LETLTTKHSTTYYHPHHHAYPYPIWSVTPGWPIISGCDSPTDRLSSFIDTHLKPLCSSLPSYVKDTNHFLQTIFNITTPLPPNTILATIDVKSLYTNIPHNEGICTTLGPLDTKHRRMWPLHKVIHQFLIHILKENYFTFNDQLYLQKHGTAMGTKMAPSFSNIFMGTLEESLLSSAPNTSYPSWYILDLDTWRGIVSNIHYTSQLSAPHHQTWNLVLHPECQFPRHHSLCHSTKNNCNHPLH
jgi:hypothetical protein